MKDKYVELWGNNVQRTWGEAAGITALQIITQMLVSPAPPPPDSRHAHESGTLHTPHSAGHKAMAVDQQVEGALQLPTILNREGDSEPCLSLPFPQPGPTIRFS